MVRGPCDVSWIWQSDVRAFRRQLRSRIRMRPRRDRAVSVLWVRGTGAAVEQGLFRDRRHSGCGVLVAAQHACGMGSVRDRHPDPHGDLRERKTHRSYHRLGPGRLYRVLRSLSRLDPGWRGHGTRSSTAISGSTRNTLRHSEEATWSEPFCGSSRFRFFPSRSCASSHYAWGNQSWESVAQ